MKIELIGKSGRFIGAFDVADRRQFEHPIVSFNSRLYRYRGLGIYREWQPTRLFENPEQPKITPKKS